MAIKKESRPSAPIALKRLSVFGLFYRVLTKRQEVGNQQPDHFAEVDKDLTL
jgi:hypothetical protein